MTLLHPDMTDEELQKAADYLNGLKQK
jgi:hypothetical protein